MKTMKESEVQPRRCCRRLPRLVPGHVRFHRGGGSPSRLLRLVPESGLRVCAVGVVATRFGASAKGRRSFSRRMLTSCFSSDEVAKPPKHQAACICRASFYQFRRTVGNHTVRVYIKKLALILAFRRYVKNFMGNCVVNLHLNHKTCVVQWRGTRRREGAQVWQRYRSCRCSLASSSL